MEEVKEHPYVIQCDAAKPLIVDTFKFMYDLDFLNPQAEEVIPFRSLSCYIHITYLFSFCIDLYSS